jgi:PST family polysaccharide transporter
MSESSIKKAALINFISRYANIFIQLIYNAILSRILIPEDFGIVAIISVFVTFFMIFADMGFGSAVVQNKTLTKNEINNIFTFTVYLAILLVILFSLFSIPLAKFYKNNVYIPIGVLLSFALFFNTVNMIPNAVLLRNKKFKTVGIRLVVTSLFGSILSIILAMFGWKYYSIVFYSIIVALFTFLWNYKSTKLKFTMKFEVNSVKKIWGFSSFQLGFNFINYFSRNADNLLIGKFMGNTPLAYYDKSYKLMLYPVNNLTNVITPVLHPILSDFQHDKSYIYSQYLKVVKVLSLLGVFISAYCFFAAEEIIVILYGNQWLSAAPSFQILALSVWVQMISSSSGSIFQSVGNTKLLFFNGLITSIITVVAILIGIGFQNINAVALCVTIAYNMHFFITYYMLIKKGFGYKLWTFFKKIISDIVVFIILFAGLFLFSNYIKINNVLISALLKGVVGLIFYLLGLVMTKQHKILISLIKRRRKTVKQNA